ncbi:MAG TPA: VIT1/CCC1 transporter family protein [Candidatus Nitrosotenuis sp.]|nr:VIT1/CCC1 transporter family protein [Candidatus Nitrosotenuis sp.]
MLKRHYHRRHKNLKNGFFLSFLDGLEGGFAIFAGIVVGLSFSDLSRDVLVATALIGIFVNAVNAAALRYSTEHYVDELDGHEKRHPFRHYFVPAVLEFFVYILFSSLALLPLIFVDQIVAALIIMVLSCLAILFTAGAVRGHLIARRHWLRDGIEVTLGGVIMMSVGASAGYALSHAF